MQIQTVGARGVYVCYCVPGGHLYLLYRYGESRLYYRLYFEIFLAFLIFGLKPREPEMKKEE